MYLIDIVFEDNLSNKEREVNKSYRNMKEEIKVSYLHIIWLFT